MNRVCLLTLSLIPFLVNASDERSKPDGYHYDSAVGWYWYNMPEPDDKKTPNDKIPASKASPTELMAKMKRLREDLLNTAILNPTVGNIKRYKEMQDFMVNKASMFSSVWEKVLLNNPDLDYNLKHPIYNGAAPIEYAKKRQDQARAIEYVNQRYGVFFFYRGKEPLDNKLGEVVKEFSNQYGIPFIPVTIDGRVNPELPQSKHDSGQAARMKITHFPAIFLVEPANQTYKPLAYGFITQDDLARRVLNVVTDFKPQD